MRKFIQAADVEIDETTGALLVKLDTNAALSALQAATLGTGNPFNFFKAAGSDDYAGCDTSPTIDRACSKIFVSVKSAGVMVKIGTAEFHVPANSARNIAFPIAAQTAIQVKNLDAGENFAGLRIEVF